MLALLSFIAVIALAAAFLTTMMATPLPGPPANMISAGLTLPNAFGEADGIIRLPLGGSAPFTVSATNIGGAASLTAVPATSAAGKDREDLGLQLFVCETTGSPSAACLAAASASLLFVVQPHQQKTFTVFVNSDGTPIAFDPANNRVFLHFRQGTLNVGGSSAAVRTE
jgi:hypothetical protein